jgi:hypothetical protein
MLKRAGTFQVSFTGVKVFLYSASDFGVSCMETSNTCESAFTEGQCLPTFTTQDIYCVCLVVYLCLLLPLTVFQPPRFQALEIDSFFTNFFLVVVLLTDSLSLIYAVTQNWSTNQSTALHDRISRIVEYCCLS